MLTVTNIVSLIAGMPTFTSKPATTATPVISALGEYGEVNIFYTGFPPHHPLVEAQGWDPIRVDIGLRNDTLNLISAGYNVYGK
jgi:hypothetical protein